MLDETQDRASSRSGAEGPVQIRSAIIQSLSRRHGYVAALAGAAVVVLVRLGLNAPLADRSFFILYMPVVLVAAALGGRGPALLATALCLGVSALSLGDALWSDPANLIDALGFALLGPLIAVTGETLWRRSREASSRQAHLQSILETVPEAFIVIVSYGFIK